MVGEAPSLPSYAEAAPTPSVPGAAAPVPTSEPEPDIDELMARLERISMEIFKRTPKELSQLPSEEETTGTPDEK
jgi:hypothetical protein